MTDKQKLAILVGDSPEQAAEHSDLYDLYLDIAADKILEKAYPFDREITQLPERYKNLQLEIAAYLINKRGADGQLAHSENGISRTYEAASVPESMLKGVIPHGKVFIIGATDE